MSGPVPGPVTVMRWRQLRAALAGLSDAFTTRVRLIRVVDVVLAHYARRFTVPELEAIATRIVRTLNPPDPKGAHERRFLHMSQLPDGTWRARFECGPEQGLRIKRALAAFSAPRPGTAIDADGVEHAIPDTRDLGARQIDAVSDIIAIALAKTGITLPTDTHTARRPPDCPTRPNHGRPVRSRRPTSTRATPMRAQGDAAGDDAAVATTPPLATTKARSGQHPVPRTRTQTDQPRTSRRRARARPSCSANPGADARPTPRPTSSWSPASNTSPPPGPTAPTAYPSTSTENFDAWLRDRLTEPHPTREPAEEQPAEERPANDANDPEERPTDGRTRTDEPRRTNHQKTHGEPLTEEHSGEAAQKTPAKKPAEEPPGAGATGRITHAPTTESPRRTVTADGTIAAATPGDWAGCGAPCPLRHTRPGGAGRPGRRRHPGTARLQRHHPGGAARPGRRPARPRPHPTPGQPGAEDRPARPRRRLRHPRLHRPRRRLRRPPRPPGGPAAAPPTWTTSPWPAAATTPKSTRERGRSRSATASPGSPHPAGSTALADHSATPPTTRHDDRTEGPYWAWSRTRKAAVQR